MALLRSGTRIYGNATVDTFLTVSGTTPATNSTTGAIIVAGGIGASGNIFSSGNLVVAHDISANNAVFNGNLIINGNIVYSNVDTMNIKDPVIEQGGNPNGSPLVANDNQDRGQLLHYYTTKAVDAFMGWDNSNAEFALGSNVSINNNVVTFNQYGNVRAAFFVGDGSALSNINPLNINGSVLNAVHANTADLALSVAGTNVAGQVGNAFIASTVYTNAQPNITSVGTLSGLSVAGVTSLGPVSNVKILGGTSGYVLSTDGTGNLTWAAQSSSSSSGTPGGTDTDIQFNDGGSFSGSANLTFNKTSNTLTVDKIVANGIGLTSITGANVTGVVGNASHATIADSANAVSGSNVSGTVAFATTANSVAGANVSGVVGNATHATVSDSANSVAGANVTGQVSNSLISGTVYTAAQPNITSVGTLTVLAVTGNITSGNASLGNLVVANYYSGNGSLLTALAGANVTGTVANATYATTSGTANSVAGANVSGQVANALIAGTVYTNAQPNITSVGTLSSLAVTNDVTVGGNLTVNGTTTTVNSTTVSINDVNIVLANNATTAAQANGAGITINGAAANFLYNSTSNSFTFSHPITANGSLLTSLTGANVTGNVGNATHAYVADAANLVAGANVSGQVANALIAGTVYTNAQPNITSIGTLTSLIVTGNASAGNISGGNLVSANYISGDGSLLTSITGANVTGNVGNATHAYVADAANSVAGANVTGAVAYAAIANAVTGANVTGNVAQAVHSYFSDVANSVAAANITGQVANSLIAGTVYTNAQPNITSVGTLTGLTVSGLLTATGTGIKTSNIVDSTGTIAITTHYNNEPGSVGITSNLTVSGKSYLGDVSNVQITGGTANYVLGTDGTGNLSWVAQTSGGSSSSGGESTVTSVDTFTGDGTTTIFTLSVAPQSINQTFINYNGALQLRNAYTVSGQNVTFSEAPANGSVIEVTTQMGVTSGSGNLTVRNYTADGVQTAYTVSAGVNATNILVTENGLLQMPAVDYTVTGSTLTFATAPGYNVKIQVRELGIAVATITPVGSNTQVLFNDAGSFGNSAGLTFSKSSNTLTVANLIVSSTVAGNLVPSANVTYNLGSSTSRWKDLYLSGNTIDLAGAQLKTDSSGAMLLVPAPSVSTPNPTALLITATGGVNTVATTGGTISSGNLANAIAATTTSGVSTKKSFFLNQAGTLSVYTGTARWYAPGNISISEVTARLINSADANVGININQHLGSNGNVITSNITIGSGNVKVKGNLTISMIEDDYLTIDVTSVGTSNVGSDLNLVFIYTDA